MKPNPTKPNQTKPNQTKFSRNIDVIQHSGHFKMFSFRLNNNHKIHIPITQANNKIAPWLCISVFN